MEHNIPRRRLDPARRRLRARLAGRWLFDTLDACLFYEKGQHPVYIIPLDLLDPTMLKPFGGKKIGQDGRWWSLQTERDLRPGVVRTWPDPPADLPILHHYAVVEMAAADAWFEEDTEVFNRPRDPYRRVDILESSRYIRIEIDGLTVAESRRPRLVLETGLPPQWYLPRPDIDWHFLAASIVESRCQYKGKARYWDVTTGEQTHKALAWSYQETVIEAAALFGLVGFPRTRAEVKTFVDGQLQPQTFYSPDWHSPSMAFEIKSA
ncbi:MAG: DUF427 domain-containing protein [Ardenticatenaceae bacterium]|nr:DUF427 domain-containing protein [Ardenticatenaceae bacterium]